LIDICMDMDGEKEVAVAVAERDNDVVVMMVISLIVGWTFGHDGRWIYSESFFTEEILVTIMIRVCIEYGKGICSFASCIVVQVVYCCVVLASLVLLVEKMSGSLAISEIVNLCLLLCSFFSLYINMTVTEGHLTAAHDKRG
jgi:hypothetical protein